MESYYKYPYDGLISSLIGWCNDRCYRVVWKIYMMVSSGEAFPLSSARIEVIYEGITHINNYVALQYN